MLTQGRPHQECSLDFEIAHIQPFASSVGFRVIIEIITDSVPYWRFIQIRIGGKTDWIHTQTKPVMLKVKETQPVITTVNSRY